MDGGGVSTALRIPADHAAVPFVRCTIAAMLSREGWDAESAGRILLASSEAISNAIDHGSPDGGAVMVEFSICEARTDLWVRDEGRPGVPAPRVPHAAPSPASPDGRGLLIMMRLSEQLEVRAVDGGTEVHAGFTRGGVSACTGAAARTAARRRS